MFTRFNLIAWSLFDEDSIGALFEARFLMQRLSFIQLNLFILFHNRLRILKLKFETQVCLKFAIQKQWYLKNSLPYLKNVANL